MRRRLDLLVVVCLLLLWTSSVEAGTIGNYWHGFKQYWSSTFFDQNGVVTTVLVCGAIGIFIITRGKWKK